MCVSTSPELRVDTWMHVPVTNSEKILQCMQRRYFNQKLRAYTYMCASTNQKLRVGHPCILYVSDKLRVYAYMHVSTNHQLRVDTYMCVSTYHKLRVDYIHMSVATSQEKKHMYAYMYGSTNQQLT